MTLPLGVETDSLSDVEVGAVVWSRTLRDSSNNPVGGPVIGSYVNDDGSFEFVVLRRGRDGYWRHVLDGDDIDMALTTFYGADARKHAAGLHAWLGQKAAKQLDDGERVTWGQVAAALDVAGLPGQWTTRAMRRYRDRFDAKRAAEAAS